MIQTLKLMRNSSSVFKIHSITDGWASAFIPAEDRLFGVGVIDFAGSTVVHMVGGLTALIGAIILGPRTGKYRGGQVQVMVFQSSTFQTLGTLILWFGW